MDFPVGLDSLAFSNAQRFLAEAAHYRLVSEALGPRPSPVVSLAKRLWAMATGSVGALREEDSFALRPPVNA